jgi:hypothetical protein
MNGVLPQRISRAYSLPERNRQLISLQMLGSIWLGKPDKLCTRSPANLKRTFADGFPGSQSSNVCDNITSQGSTPQRLSTTMQELQQATLQEQFHL